MSHCADCSPSNCPHYNHCVERNPMIQRAEIDHVAGPLFPDDEKPNSKPWPEWPIDDEI